MILRWSLTAALAVPMAAVFYLLNAEKIAREQAGYLPDTDLPFDQFQQALSAHRAAMMSGAAAWTALWIITVFMAAAAAAWAHQRLFRAPSKGLARFHRLTMIYTLPAFGVLTFTLVAQMRL